jgi:hypothetical protein
MSRLRSSCLVAMGILLSSARVARAFSDPSSFALPPTQAGGGGRFFTGSPADGYTCKVCHVGGVETSLRVLGLPLAGYVSQQRYEIVVDWPDTIDKISLAAELTDAQGKPVGTLRLPPNNETQPAEFCAPASDMVPAASLTDAGAGRQIISVPDCGAKQLRFLWTAPINDIGPVWFASSAVVSNGMGDTDGDGVTDVTRVIAPAGDPPALASSVTAGCNVAPGAHSGLGWYGWCLLAVFRRRSRRAASRNVRRR